MDKGKGKGKKKNHSGSDDDDLDLTLRLSLGSNDEQNTKEKEPRLPKISGSSRGNSNDEAPSYRCPNIFAKHGPLPTTNWGGSYTHGGAMAGVLVTPSPMPPIIAPTIRGYGPTLSSHDLGFLPSTGFATPSRNRHPNPNEQGRCRMCQATSSCLWRKGPDGPRTLCNKCGLKHSRSQKKGDQ